MNLYWERTRGADGREVVRFRGEIVVDDVPLLDQVQASNLGGGCAVKASTFLAQAAFLFKRYEERLGDGPERLRVVE